jgi:trigger factor
MNVTLKNTDSVNAAITIEIAKADYEKEVENGLKELRRNANIPGFRKGMVPVSRIRSLYGKSILVEEINKLVSGKLYDYIKEKDLKILGEPLPALGEVKPLDFDSQEDYEFTFDIGLAPEIDIKLTKDDKLTYYKIAASDDMLNRQLESFKSSFGSYEKVEDIKERDMVKGHLLELDETGAAKTDGLNDENAVLMPSYIKDEGEKAKFLEAKLNTILVFNPYKAYEGNEAELSSFLKVKKEEVVNYQNDFSFEIKEISRHTEAELNQELFDKVLGPGVADSEVSFLKKVKSNIEKQLLPESDYKFILDAKKALLEKATDLQFPDEFLKRWLLVSNPDRTAESFEEDYPKIIEDLKYHLIEEQLIKDNGLTVEDAEIKEASENAIRAQFAAYGMSDVPAQLLENYSQEQLKKEDTVRNLISKVLETKLIKVLKEQATVKNKKTTVEDFQKMFEKEAAAL